MSEPEAKRRGRPPKPDAVRNRGSLTVRMRDEVRSELQSAAIKYGRSLSEEMETRMEISLARKDQLKYEWGDDLYRIATAMADSLSRIENWSGKKWFEDQKTFEIFKLTTASIIQNYKDILDRNARGVPAGGFDSKSPEELAQIFAAVGGIAPPRPKRSPVEIVVTDEDPPSQIPAESADDRPEDAALPAAKVIKSSTRVCKPSS